MDETSRAEAHWLVACGQLLDVAAAVAGEEDVSEILDGVFVRLRDLVPFDRMEFATVEEGGMALVTRWVRTTYEGREIEPGFVYRRDAERGPFPVETGPYIERDIGKYARDKPEGHPARLLAAEGIVSAISCPLAVRGERVGFLFFGSTEARAFDEVHLWVVQRLAAVLAGAIRMSRLSEELAEQNRELEELSRFRTTYLATISHELRTPLTAVVGLAVTLRDARDALEPDEVTELVGLIATQAMDAAAIVEDLLVVARAEAGQLVVAEEQVDLAAEAQTAVESVGGGIPVRGEARPACGDPTRVRQILRNLLTNARRYGGPEVWIELGESADGVTVTVCDNGPGIPEEERELVFAPFRSGSAAQAERGSVGLGLWVSRQLATLMGGTLEYAYVDGISRFTLTLPAV